MARMIPAQIYNENPSRGEKEIFHRLTEDPDTKDWIVLHSLDVANHIKQIFGEIDFVIIVPNKGVLCLEVKSATKIKVEQGLWYYGDSEADSRGPFKQSSSAMHSIRRQLVKQDNNLANVVFWSAVVFPYTKFTINSVEWQSWQVIDSDKFLRNSISKLILSVLNSARHFLQNKSISWFNPSLKEPTLAQCKAINNILRPSFEVYEPPLQKISRLNHELKKYTDEQFNALDVMSDNMRIIFKGPAGTGKTTMALEAAKRSHLKGNRVLFLCYNRLLGKYLESEIGKNLPNITITTLHSYMLKIADIKIDDEQYSSFWLEELPNRAIEKLLEDDEGKYSYDELIIDEAQDLLRTNYLDFLDLSVKGGLQSGKWKLFGDFEKQAIYNSNSDISLDEVLRNRLNNPSIYMLRINCRNTPRIVKLVQVLVNLKPEYSRVLRSDDNIDPKIYFYKDKEQQTAQLIETIQKLRNEGFQNTEITILSPKNFDKSVFSDLERDNIKFAPLESVSKTQIKAGTIHAFKGMENLAIIITDLDILTEEYLSLFYVAMTRALHRLYILAHDTIKRDIEEIIFLH